LEDEPQVEQELQASKIRYESIHRYELDDEDGVGSGHVLSEESA
jgi:hypothetical protein